MRKRTSQAKPGSTGERDLSGSGWADPMPPRANLCPLVLILADMLEEALRAKGEPASLQLPQTQTERPTW